MRETLTILAAAVLAILVAALAIPPFIDWSGYGDALQRRLGAALGAQVQLAGPVKVRLLPAPRLEAARLAVNGPGYTLASDRASVELGLVPLLRGVVSITSAQLERARLVLDVGALQGGARQNSADVGIERLVLRDASVSVVSGNTTHRLDHVDLTASAESAAGPFKADGYLRAASRVLPFHLATGGVAAQKLPVKLEIEPLAGLPRVEASGTLLWDGTTPRFQGAVTLSGDVPGAARDAAAPPLPWRARLEGQASPAEARADTIEVRLGDDGARLVATGTGVVAPDGALTATLGSERPDFDRFRATYDLKAIARAAATLVSAPPGGRAISLDWRADAALLGGDVLTDLRAGLARAPNAPSGQVAVSMAASLPHAGGVSVRGTLDGEGHGEGDVALRSSDAPAFSRWAGAFVPAGLVLPQVPFASVDLAGHVATTTESVEVTDIRAKLDRSDLRGRLSATPARGALPAKVTTVLTSPALDLDALPDLGSAAGAAGALDLSVSLEAQAIRVARVGRGTVDAGRIVVSFSRAGETVSLDRLDLENVGGATARMHGQLTPGRAHLAGALEAAQLTTLAALARRVAPSLTADALAARASVLAPAKLDFELDAATSDGVWRPSSISLSGTAGGTRVTALLSPARERRDGVAGSLTLDAPEAAPLLQQIGVPVLPVRGLGGGQIEARLSGRAGAPLSIAVTARLAGATVVFAGTSSIDPEAPSAEGQVRISAADLAPLLRILGIPTDLLARLSVNASATFAGTGERIALSAIQGLVGPSRVAGDLQRESGGSIAGALRLDRLDIGSLASLLLGRAPPITGDRLWSPLVWSAQPPDPPVAAIDLAIGQLALGAFGSVSDMRGHLGIGPRAIEARDLHAQWAGGTVAGEIALKRQGETASLRANLSAENAAVTLPWVDARASGQIELAGAGPSPAALVGSLAGPGRFSLTDARLPRADPTAPARVAADVDAERVALDPRTIEATLARELGRAPHAFAMALQPVRIAAGQAFLAPFDVANTSVAAGVATLSGKLDLTTGRIEIGDLLRPAPPQGWTGLPPALRLSWTGPVGAPLRTSDASELIGTLAAHGLAREQARIAAQEADQRERTFFNRRLKSERAAEAERRAEEARLEAARLEALRQDALRQEALRQDVLRQEAARREATRLERERRAAEPAPGTAPLNLRPSDLSTPKDSSTPRGTPSILAPDPSSAGRY